MMTKLEVGEFLSFVDNLQANQTEMSHAELTGLVSAVGRTTTSNPLPH